MNVLVTGGAGYIGSVVAGVLLARGHDVRVLDSLLCGGRALLSLYHEDRFSFVRGDIRSASTVERALDGVDAVVHLAAIVGDPACARQPALAREVNLDASLQLFDLCRLRRVKRFVFVSTCSNYGRMSEPSDYLTEDSELRPVSLYAETKVGVEKALMSAGVDGGPAVSVLRFATVFGLSPRMRFDLTVNEFTMELLIRRKLVIFGERCWRPYIHVRDTARAIARVLDAGTETVAGRVFNVGGTEENYQKKQLVELICAEVGGDVEIQYVHQVDDPRDYRVSFEKVKTQLGFRVTRTVPDGIREIADAIRQGVVTDFDDPRYRNLREGQEWTQPA